MRRLSCTACVLGLLVAAGGCHPQLREEPIHPVVFQLDYDQGERSPPEALLPVKIAIVRVAYGYQEYWHSDRNSQRKDQFFVLDHADPDLGQSVERLSERMKDVAEIKLIQVQKGDGSERFSVQKLRGLNDKDEMEKQGWQYNTQGLRGLAGAAGCDLVLVYSAAVRTKTGGWLAILTLFTMGYLPTLTEKSDCQAFAALIDVKTGYVFQTLDAEHHAWQIASARTCAEAMRQAADRSRRGALTKVLRQFESDWPSIRGRIEERSAPTPAH